MTLRPATLAGRRLAEQMMLDACTIKRRTGTSTDPDTGVVTDTYAAAFYTGKCRVQTRDTLGRAEAAGERVAVVGRLVVSVPMSVTGVEVDDVVTITSSDLDADLEGRAFRVAELFHKSAATARRLVVEEVQS